MPVFDADTHLQPSTEVMTPYLGPVLRERQAELDAALVEIKVGRAGEILEPPYKHWWRFGRGGGGWGGSKLRVLGEAGPRQNEERHFQKFMGSRFPTEGGVEFADVRLKDMDEEGVDVELMVPSGTNGHPDPEIEMEFLRAEHRYLDEFCATAPRRLKSLIVVSARAVESSVAEIKYWSRSSWAVGVQPYLPLDYPIDHPDLEPLWRAAEDANLCVVHHSFATGYPGYRDLWDNPFLGRTASHPWAAQRAMAAFIGSGIMERHPNLRFAILESGFGWLPSWVRRMDDQVEYMGYVGQDLKHKPSEYVMGGRFFASIVLHEGPEMIRVVNDLLGDQILMFGSDYPHAESRFPESVRRVQGWDQLRAEEQRKLFWDNAVRAFGEP
ncbi:MAG: amidohydrolase [Chloroflexi bacterium]|nr:amidohydrolase [Chloroflexota bacterium]